MKIIFPTLCTLLVVSCASNPSEQASLPKTSLDTDVPILTAKGLGKGWKLDYQKVDESGQSYQQFFNHESDPFEKLIIYGSTKPFPKMSKPPVLIKPSMDGLYENDPGIKVPQDWKTTQVMGQVVRWYQESVSGGADGPYFSTEGLTFTNPEGQTGHYRLVVESITGAEPERFARVGWEN